MSAITDLPDTCYVCGERPRLTYSHACRQCDPVARLAPAPRCVAPLRCYCPNHLGAPIPPASESLQAIRNELEAARARRAAAAQEGVNR